MWGHGRLRRTGRGGIGAWRGGDELKTAELRQEGGRTGQSSSGAEGHVAVAVERLRTSYLLTNFCRKESLKSVESESRKARKEWEDLKSASKTQDRPARESEI
mmetsp:Transcript_3701/g.7040  ORF Transcript_3701/g.7040 Transcript_3701/m.7040 type:complete len:103 (-) Transcript_3701:125-433(-)